MICLNHSRLHHERDTFEARKLHQLLKDWCAPEYLRRLVEECDLASHVKYIEAVDGWMQKRFKQEQYTWTLGWNECMDPKDVRMGLTLCLMVDLGRPEQCPDEGDLFAVLPFEVDVDGIGIGTPHLMRFEINAHHVNLGHCSLMAKKADNTQWLFRGYAFPLSHDTTAHWLTAWKSNHDDRMLQKMFEQLGRAACLDFTPIDNELEVKAACQSAKDILDWIDIAHGAGKSIDWKMRLRNGAYKSQITSEELTSQMLKILQELREEKHWQHAMLTRYFAQIANRKGVSGMLLDTIWHDATEPYNDVWTQFRNTCYHTQLVGETTEEWSVPVSEELLHAVNWCVNYHIGMEIQKKQGDKSILITMDQRDWRKRGQPLVRKLKAEGFTSIAVMMYGKPDDSPEWREVHHLNPHDATYLATCPDAVHLPQFSAYLHHSQDLHVAKCLRELGPEVTPLIVNNDALRSWRGSYYERLDLPWSSASIAEDLMRLAINLECGCKFVNRDEPGWFFTPQKPRYTADEPRGRASWNIGQEQASWGLAVKILRGESTKLTSSAARIDWHVGVAKDTVICTWGYPVLMVVAKDREDANRPVLLIGDQGWQWLRDHKETGLMLWYRWMKPLLRKGVRLRRVSDFTVTLTTFTQDLPLDRPISALFATQAIHQRKHGWFH